MSETCSVCLSVRPSVCLSHCLSVCLSVPLSSRPSVGLSFCPSVHPSIRPSVLPYLCLRCSVSAACEAGPPVCLGWCRDRAPPPERRQSAEPALLSTQNWPIKPSCGTFPGPSTHQSEFRPQSQCSHHLSHSPKYLDLVFKYHEMQKNNSRNQ